MALRTRLVFISLDVSLGYGQMSRQASVRVRQFEISADLDCSVVREERGQVLDHTNGVCSFRKTQRQQRGIYSSYHRTLPVANLFCITIETIKCLMSVFCINCKDCSSIRPDIHSDVAESNTEDRGGKTVIVWQERDVQKLLKQNGC